ncbi:MAG TPA: ABC transporter permease [Ktedonobacteraceae bacterium]|nr:ABC transporter permease [Ktedonobacteraceae bacterium]
MAMPTEFREEAQIAEYQPVSAEPSRFANTLSDFRRDPRWWLGLVLLAFVLAAIFAPLISPYDPLAYHPAVAEQPPTWAHLLGTDSLGRDQLSRVIYGTRISLTVGLVSILLGGLCGTVLGMLAAYFRGWVDQVVAILVDALLAFPALILALAIVAALGPSLVNVAVAIAVVRIPIYTRLARGQTLQVVSQDYVQAAHSAGTGSLKIMFRHILPNIFSPLLVQATLSISFAILDESVLSFLGLGAQPPTPEWGAMVTDAQTFLASDPWMMLGPALAIVVVLLSLNLFGDALRDRLDPRDARRISAPFRLGKSGQ